MEVVTYIIDTFTASAFSGNPTAVCYGNQDLAAGKMQSMATELNLPVTAFITKRHERVNEYDIRYFTPLTEIPACGHATLASAKFASVHDAVESTIFHTRENIQIRTVCEGNTIMMTYPKFGMYEYNVEPGIIQALAIPQYLFAGYSDQLETLFIQLHDPRLLRSVMPDFKKLMETSSVIKEVVITSASDDPRYDYLLRSFCPWIGIDEDPVTGSVHSVLAAFWEQRLKKRDLRAWQASQRGGSLLIRSNADHVEIGGESVVVLKGTFSV